MFFLCLAQLVGIFLDRARLLMRPDRSKAVDILLVRRQLAILQRTQVRPRRLTRWEKLTQAVFANRVTRLGGGARTP
jgi:hypothetical protein